MTTVRALLEEAAARFEDAGLAYGHGTSDALEEASWLVLHAAGLPLDALHAHLDHALPPVRERTARALVDERIRTRKPAAYLLREAWLGAHRFYVDERVIVPRSFIFELLPKMGTDPMFGSSRRPSKVATSPRSVLDLCTGSGCLAILAALQFPEATVDAVDLSDDALAVAGRNVRDYRLEERVRLVKSDLFQALGGRRYDLIVSNPPYVKAASMRKLPEEYRREPRMALASGPDGLEHTRVILREARRHLTPGGTLVVEIGHNRKALERAYPDLPFRWPRVAAGTGFVFVLSTADLPEDP